VDWHPWGAEALARAKAEDKPILLSIGYSAFHWCHVMEREAFEDDAIAALMNDHCVPVKVDRAAQSLIKANAVAAVVFLLVGGVFGLSIALTRWPAVHLLPADWFYLALTAHGFDVLLAWIIFFARSPPSPPGEEMVTVPSSSTLMVAPVASCIPRIVFPFGPMISPILAGLIFSVMMRGA
jgi:hypothetical protein